MHPIALGAATRTWAARRERSLQPVFLAEMSPAHLSTSCLFTRGISGHLSCERNCKEPPSDKKYICTCQGTPVWKAGHSVPSVCSHATNGMLGKDYYSKWCGEICQSKPSMPLRMLHKRRHLQVRPRPWPWHHCCRCSTKGNRGQRRDAGLSSPDFHIRRFVLGRLRYPGVLWGNKDLAVNSTLHRPPTIPTR